MTLPIPKGLILSTFQDKGVRYMLGARGSLSADEMGLGKTVQTIVVLNAMNATAPQGVFPHLSRRGSRYLIVAPAGLRYNWHEELKNWYVGSDGKSWPQTNDYVRVASYYEAEKIGTTHPLVQWDALIVDEAQYIKNGHTQRSQAIQRLNQQTTDRVILISGTPYENAPVELWPLLQIVAPEKWDPEITKHFATTPEQKKAHPGEGYNFWEFCKRYCDLKKTKIKIGKRFKSVYDFSGGSNLEELQRRLRETCMVRRLKADVLTELPPKRRQIVVLQPEGIPINDDDLLPNLTDENYEMSIGRLTAEKVKFEEWSKRRHAQGLMLVTPVLEVLENTFADPQERRILFCHHTDVAEAYFRALEQMDLSPVLVTGKTHPADRMAAVKRFQGDPKCRVFIGSIRAAGVGLTLTAATGVDFAEQSPIPGEMSQAEDRAHRIGQTRFLLIRIFVANRSLSARMMKIVIRKQALIREGLDTMAKEEPMRAT